MRKTKEGVKGITLISLVITIILLLILAGITIAQLTGSGLFEKAQLAAEESKKAQIQETLQLEVNSVLVKYLSKGEEITNIKLKEQLENNESLEGITINNDLTGTYEGYEYYIDEDYNVYMKDTSSNDNKPVFAKIEGKEEKRIINVTVTEAEEGIQKIELVNPSGEIVGTQELDGAVTTGKLENCIANQSGNYKVNVTLNNGTVENKIINVKKIQISNKTELEDFRDMVNNGITFEGDTIELVADIDLQGSNDNRNWKAIGGAGSDKYFAGTFEGNNHKILNMYDNENNKNQKGFFGHIINGTVQNLGIESGSIIGHHACGGIVGRIDNGDIINCYNKAKIEDVGAGGSLGSITLGGIAGNARDGSTISKCYNEGEIKGNSEVVGGIVGIAANEIKIYNCYNKGKVTADVYAGGIVGIMGADGQNIIDNCYNKADITATTTAGGLVGEVRTKNEVKNSYNVGNVTGKNNIGGVIGSHNGSISNLFFINTAGPAYGCGINNTDNGLEEPEGSTIETLKQLTNKLNGTQSEIVWKDDIKNINEGYPILSWQ